MEWTAANVVAINYGLNESTICAIRYEPVPQMARVYVELIGHPIDGPNGPTFPDRRTVLVLSGVSWLEFRLRFDGPTSERPPPISSLQHVEDLLADSWITDPMYGWDFVDSDDPHEAVREEPDLALGPGPRRSGHCLDWFVELLPNRNADRLWLNGSCYFTNVTIERADGAVEPIEVFDANAIDDWKTVFEPERKISTEVYNAASHTRRHWRPPDGHGPLSTAV